MPREAAIDAESRPQIVHARYSSQAPVVLGRSHRRAWLVRIAPRFSHSDLEGRSRRKSHPLAVVSCCWAIRITPGTPHRAQMAGCMGGSFLRSLSQNLCNINRAWG